jgi:hypothetical protein
MPKTYNSHLYKPSINDVVLEGNKTLEELRIEYTLKGDKHTEIVPGGTEEEPDPKHPVINILNIQEEGWESESVFTADGETATTQTLKSERDEETKKTKLTIENFYDYTGSWIPYFSEETKVEETGIWIITKTGDVSVFSNVLTRCQTVIFTGTVLVVWIPFPIPGGEYYHDEYFIGTGTKEDPIRLNMNLIFKEIYENNQK